ncbi:MAG: isoleucine--tRNA ligase [Anaerolineae bacterium]|nr:isoleucine--tRNA ligase [Anaerolineae bacterium]
MFKPVTPKLNLTILEETILRYWKQNHIFQRSMTERTGGPEFVFYEGPPTANGRPGVHHVLARVFKDIFPRYKTMRGFHVLRRGGWDTHGLPVEIEVEKKLGFTNKQQIEKFGIAEFNELCRKSAFEYIQDWEKLTERIAYWVDFDTAYVTYKNEYIESVWHILKTFWEKGLLYQWFKVVPYCPRCGTPLSDHEVSLGYQEGTVDPSVFVRMPLVDQPGTSLLVWTTTPWTLPGNVAVAASPTEVYVTVERDLPEGGQERLILAESLVARVFADEDVRVVNNFTGKQLYGKRYQPLFTFLPLEKPAHRVVMGDFVTTEDGTGLVHIAPAFGAEDMQMATEEDLPILMTVKEDGTFINEVRPWSGQFVKDADPLIINDLDQRGLLFRAETYTHTYPFCWRCSTPLLYYARQTWYIRTSQYRDKLVELNQQINWYPEHIKNGRFGNWLENNIDWALGRERYWGTPLPVWECQSCRHQLCIGSVAELSNLSGSNLSDIDLHRPYVDQVKLTCPECKTGEMRRVPELIDVWFDSGSMPAAQWHFPFENGDKFSQQFPADYICEAVDQTRGWFYSLHAISTLLFEQVCFKNVVSLGLILDGQGRKMSKSLGNVGDPWTVINEYGADAMRWYLLSASPPGQERRFSADLVKDVVKNFTLTLWNTYSFFVTYANLDGWTPQSSQDEEYSALDEWIISSMNVLIRDVTNALEHYDSLGATRPIEAFVDQLSNWYLRRSRRRFWKSGSDADKNAAYQTLYQALVTVCKLLAPSMPFLAEEIYQNLVLSVDRNNNPDSVHLALWPEPDLNRTNESLNREMALVMKLASLGLAARNKAHLPVRQPLQEAAFALGSLEDNTVVDRYADILMDELNVKKVRTLSVATEAAELSVNPLPKQLGQKYGRLFPAVRHAIMLLDVNQVAAAFLAGESVKIQVDANEYQINSDEVEIRMQAREGYAVASEGGYLAALVTEQTPELIQEGLAREFIRRVQDLRKQAGLDIADRIHLVYQASPALMQAIARHRDYIMTETLALSAVEGAQPQGWVSLEDSFSNETMMAAVQRAE